MTTKESSLPTDRAFVVQFCSQETRTPLRDEGRVEHLVSGQARHFHSWEDLREFVEHVLTSIAEKPP